MKLGTVLGTRALSYPDPTERRGAVTFDGTLAVE